MLREGSRAADLAGALHEYGFAHGYESVKRSCARSGGGGRRWPTSWSICRQEGQVDYFKSPAPVLNPTTGKWGRPWIFRMTLSCSRHGYEEPMWRQQRDGLPARSRARVQKFEGVPAVVRPDYVARNIIGDQDPRTATHERETAHVGGDPLGSSWDGSASA